MYYDESLVPLAAEPDASLGRGVARAVAVRHLWVVDEEAVYEERVVAEYPETGGVDVALVEVSPGSGHWETTDASGLPVAYDGPLPPPNRLGQLRLDQLGIFPGSLGHYGSVRQGMPVVTIELKHELHMPDDGQVLQMWRDLLRWMDNNLADAPARNAH